MAQLNIKKAYRGTQLTRIDELNAENESLLNDVNVSDDAKSQARKLIQSTQDIITAENFTPRDKIIYELGMAQAINNTLKGQKAYSETMVGDAYKNAFGYYSKSQELPWMVNETVKRTLAQGANPQEQQYIMPEDGSTIKDPFVFEWKSPVNYEYLQSGLDANQRINIYVDDLLHNIQRYLSTDFSKYNVDPAELERNRSTFNQYITELNAIKTGNQPVQEKLSALNRISTAVKGINEDIFDIYGSLFAPELDNSTEAQAARAASAQAAALKASRRAAESYGGYLPEGYNQFAPTADTQAYINHLRKNGVIVGTRDGKNYAFDANGNPTTSKGWYINDFTSPIYQHGIVIDSNGQIHWGNDLTALRDVDDAVYTNAYTSANDALKNKYKLFSPHLVEGRFGDIPDTTQLVDLSNYFKGSDIILAGIPENDPDPYNWSTKQLYKVTKDPETGKVQYTPISWESVKKDFDFAGNTDRSGNPEEDAMLNNQFTAGTNLHAKPADWDQYKAESGTIIGSSFPSIGVNINADGTFIINRDPTQNINLAYLMLLADFVTMGADYADDLWAEKIDKDTLKRMCDWIINIYNKKDEGQRKQLIKSLLGNDFNKLPSEYRQKLLDTWNDPKDVSSNVDLTTLKEGGEIQMMQNGSNIFAERQALNQRASNRGLSVEGFEKNQSTGIPNIKDWTYSDYARLAALTSDVAGLISSFAVGGGTAAAAGFGLTSLGLDLSADIADPSVTKGQVATNAAGNLFFGVLGLIPGGKAWKIIKGLAMYAPALGSAGYIGYDVANKLVNNQELTYEDWKDIYHGLSSIINVGTMGRTAAKLNGLKNTSGGIKEGYKTFTDKTSGKSFELSDAQIKKINEIGERKGTEAALAELKSMVPDDIKANLDVAFEFGKVDGDSRSIFSRGLRKVARKNMPLVGDQAMKPGYINRVAEYYKTNPRRSGNPFEANWGDPKATIGLPKFMRSDYQIAVEGKAPIGFDLPDVSFAWLRNLNAWRREHLSTHGPKYAEATQDMASVRHANGSTTTRPVKKGNTLIDVDNKAVEGSKVAAETSKLPKGVSEVVKAEGVYYGKKNNKWVKLIAQTDADGKLTFKELLHNATTNKNGGKLNKLKEYTNR